MPAFPFLMMAAFCFARSSEKLDRWFKGTKLYEENLKDFVTGKGMTVKAKVRVMVTITLLMSIGMALMGIRGIMVGCAILAVIWLFHMIYFAWGVRTIQEKDEV